MSFDTAYSSAYDVTAVVPVPPVVPSVPWERTCCAWEPDLGCVSVEEWDAYPPEVQDRAIGLAWDTLKYLTGGRVGNCSVLARPCKAACLGNNVQSYYGGMQPVIGGGRWLNLVCGCGSPLGCQCTEISEIVLPGPIATVLHVWESGALLDPTAYRIDNFNRLVRVDGDVWPLCQDLAVAWDQPGALSLEYVPGIDPGPSGLWAAGILATEWAKACTGSKCRIPTSVTNVSRQGVTMDFSEGMFAGGVTGIREVDAWIISVNPNHLAQPARVWSPDMRQPRYQT